MPNTGKIVPTVERGGILLPWRLVGILLITGLVPLWVFTVKALYVASIVDGVVEMQVEHGRELAAHRERLAVIEAKGKP